MRTILRVLLKVLAVGLVFFIGEMVGGMAAGAIGLVTPEMPAGADPGTIMLLLLACSAGIAATLGYLAAHLAGPYVLRWLALAASGWAIYSLNTYLDAVIYTTYTSASPYKLVMDAVALILAGALAARIFSPRSDLAVQPAPQLTLSGWAWRLALAWAAFPIIYLGFGKIVEPLVIDMYREQMLGMTAPGWGQIISMQMLRSAAFLTVLLGLLALWNRPRRSAWLPLGISTFLLLWGFYGIQAYWLPVGFRLAHTLEILADSLVYAFLLSVLFAPGTVTRDVRAAKLSNEVG